MPMLHIVELRTQIAAVRRVCLISFLPKPTTRTFTAALEKKRKIIKNRLL